MARSDPSVSQRSTWLRWWLFAWAGAVGAHDLAYTARLPRRGRLELLEQTGHGYWRGAWMAALVGVGWTVVHRFWMAWRTETPTGTQSRTGTKSPTGQPNPAWRELRVRWLWLALFASQSATFSAMEVFERIEHGAGPLQGVDGRLIAWSLLFQALFALILAGLAAAATHVGRAIARTRSRRPGAYPQPIAWCPGAVLASTALTGLIQPRGPPLR